MNEVTAKETVAMKMLNYSKDLSEKASFIEKYCNEKLGCIMNIPYPCPESIAEKDEDFPAYFDSQRECFIKINNSLNNIRDCIDRVAF